MRRSRDRDLLVRPEPLPRPRPCSSVRYLPARQEAACAGAFSGRGCRSAPRRRRSTARAASARAWASRSHLRSPRAEACPRVRKQHAPMWFAGACAGCCGAHGLCRAKSRPSWPRRAHSPGICDSAVALCRQFHGREHLAPVERDPCRFDRRVVSSSCGCRHLAPVEWNGPDSPGAKCGYVCDGSILRRLSGARGGSAVALCRQSHGREHLAPVEWDLCGFDRRVVSSSVWMPTSCAG